MKYLKILGLAALSAAALTAILGAGTASAATLCENNQTTGCTKHVNSGSSLEFSAEDSIKLAGPFGIVLDTCTQSTVIGTTDNTGDDMAGAVVLGLHTLTFSHCTRTTTVGSLGYLEITRISGTDNGTVRSSWATVTIHELPNIVGNPSSCAYETVQKDLGTLTGSTFAPTIDLSATINSETTACPSGTWSGHYIGTGTAASLVLSS